MARLKKNRALLFMVGAIILSACAPASGPHQPLPQAPTAKSEVISFNQILPIVRLRCARCHNEGTNDWTQEANLKRVARSGALFMRLNTHTMPQEGSEESMAITDREREILIQWAEHTANQIDGAETNNLPEEQL